jgi:uncharacterized repeat protein (TIGR03803 family)
MKPGAFLLLIIFLIYVPFIGLVSGQVVSRPVTLYSFADSSGSGTTPRAALIIGADGAMYGTCRDSGEYGLGTIYRFTFDNNFTRLASFTGTNGASPTEPLVLGTNGLLYGIATGGTNGLGVVFRFSTGQPQVLLDFASLAAATLFSSAEPSALLLNPNDGLFYGTCRKGGFVGPFTSSGSVFSLSHSGTIRLLHAFPFSEGGGPNSLLLGRDGVLYGSTTAGGTNGQGMVFAITTNGTFRQVIHFKSNVTGSSPHLCLQASDGSFYGSTFLGPAAGLASLFKLTTNGILTTLGNLSGSPFGNDNIVPNMVETPNGIYGDTRGFGHSYTFRIGTDGAVGIITNLWPEIGGPTGFLLAPNGSIYGAAAAGGTNLQGAIFKMDFSPLRTVATRASGLPSLSWGGVSGLTYQVSIASNLTTGNWFVLTNILATNSSPSFIDRSFTNSPARFYKLVVP